MNISAQNIDIKFWHISNRSSNLWADIDFVLLARCVPHEEGVGSRLLEQVELHLQKRVEFHLQKKKEKKVEFHLAGSSKPLPQSLRLLGVKLAAIDRVEI